MNYSRVTWLATDKSTTSVCWVDCCGFTGAVLRFFVVEVDPEVEGLAIERVEIEEVEADVDLKGGGVCLTPLLLSTWDSRFNTSDKILLNTILKLSKPETVQKWP